MAGASFPMPMHAPRGTGPRTRRALRKIRLGDDLILKPKKVRKPSIEPPELTAVMYGPTLRRAQEADRKKRELGEAA